MFKVSCIQICSGNNIKENLDKSIGLTLKSISRGADFILTPEVTSLFFANKKELLSKVKQMNDDIFVKEYKKICKSEKKWILLGSLLVRRKNKIVKISGLFFCPGCNQILSKAV